MDVDVLVDKGTVGDVGQRRKVTFRFSEEEEEEEESRQLRRAPPPEALHGRGNGELARNCARTNGLPAAAVAELGSPAPRIFLKGGGLPGLQNLWETIASVSSALLLLLLR